jgi:hypothetical protein
MCVFVVCDDLGDNSMTDAASIGTRSIGAATGSVGDADDIEDNNDTDDTDDEENERARRARRAREIGVHALV